MKRSKGFTLVELLVVVGIIALLVTILMPTLGRAMELARRSICGASLNTIGKGIAIYVAEHETFPLLYEDGGGNITADFRGTTDDLWNDPVLELGTNVMQNVWLQIKYGTSEKAFQCPSDGDYKERAKSASGTSLKRFGWIEKQNFSYGMHKPYNDDVNAIAPNINMAPLTDTPQGNFVLMADKNWGSQGPGRIYWTGGQKNQPSNHKDDGFNYLMWQGSVKFHKAKMDTDTANSEAGAGADDIYCTQNKKTTIPISATEMPQNEDDTFIVPWVGLRAP